MRGSIRDAFYTETASPGAVLGHTPASLQPALSHEPLGLRRGYIPPNRLDVKFQLRGATIEVSCVAAPPALHSPAAVGADG